jgi:hypothetical protein
MYRRNVSTFVPVIPERIAKGNHRRYRSLLDEDERKEDRGRPPSEPRTTRCRNLDEDSVS